MSEKSLIITGVFGIIFMSVILMYQMISLDIQKQSRNTSIQNQEIPVIQTPKIEIEIRK